MRRRDDSVDKHALGAWVNERAKEYLLPALVLGTIAMGMYAGYNYISQKREEMRPAIREAVEKAYRNSR